MVRGLAPCTYTFAYAFNYNDMRQDAMRCNKAPSKPTDSRNGP